MHRLSPEIIFENIYGSAHKLGRRMRKFGRAIADRIHLVHVYYDVDESISIVPINKVVLVFEGGFILTFDNKISKAGIMSTHSILQMIVRAIITPTVQYQTFSL